DLIDVFPSLEIPACYSFVVLRTGTKARPIAASPLKLARSPTVPVKKLVVHIVRMGLHRTPGDDRLAETV
ncbi:hypothetical protein, partial [Sinorhizobium meliloti]|uniref:hypothetical protein n=1 Tax=Rhizobium meliloti TaxID=382 RepID=UPI001AECE6A7